MATVVQLPVLTSITILASHWPKIPPPVRRPHLVDRSGGADQALRGPPGGQRHLAYRGRRRAVRAARFFGERQEHAAADDRRPDRGGRRPGDAPWPRCHGVATGPPGRGIRFPELRAV